MQLGCLFIFIRIYLRMETKKIGFHPQIDKSS